MHVQIGIILLVKCMYVQRNPGHRFIRCLTRGSNDQGVLGNLRADEVVRTVATGVAVGGNNALTPEADTVRIC